MVVADCWVCFRRRQPCGTKEEEGGQRVRRKNSDFRKDTRDVVSGLRDGGYSDDMTLATIAGNAFFRRVLLYSDLCT